VGGDCTNAACVPSKALKSASQVLSAKDPTSNNNINIAQLARQHAVQTVQKVREREAPSRLAQTPNLDLMFASQVSFQDPNTIQLEKPFLFDNATQDWVLGDEMIQVKGKKFIICTGASPTIPTQIQESAQEFDVPILTYRSFFRPDQEGKLSDQLLWNETWASENTNSSKKKRVVVLGGGPSACEIMAHSLAKLTMGKVDITIVAPTILPAEDVAARAFARSILQDLGIQLVLGAKATCIKKTLDGTAAVNEKLY